MAKILTLSNKNVPNLVKEWSKSLSPKQNLTRHAKKANILPTYIKMAIFCQPIYKENYTPY